MRLRWALPLGVVLLSSCDHGLEIPSAVTPSFGGRITYIGNWPPPDSLKDLRLVASPDYPIDTTFSQVLFKILEGTIKVYPPVTSSDHLLFNVNTSDYIFLTGAGLFKYVAVVQQFGSDVFRDWRVIGVYTVTANQAQPALVRVPEETFISGIDITVDFNHPPPQPF